jgi:hypothetical protein
LDDDINNTDEEAKIDYEELYKQQLAKMQEMELQLKEIKKPHIVLKTVNLFEVDSLINEVTSLVRTYQRV